MSRARDAEQPVEARGAGKKKKRASKRLHQAQQWRDGLYTAPMQQMGVAGGRGLAPTRPRTRGKGLESGHKKSSAKPEAVGQ